ncbi:MAG TPA: hypothetical protein VF885_24460 [Arthrobacter sp.]
MTDPARHPKGISAGGQFAPDAHAEPALALAAPRSYDPETVAKGILNDVRDFHTSWGTQLFYSTHEAVRAGKTTYGKFLDGLLAQNHGGRCERHEHDVDHSPERYCRDCHIAFMVEARTNVKPLPSPRGVIPIQKNHHLTSEQLNRDYDPRTKVEVTTSKKTGDEKFEAAVRRMFGAPEDAAVEVIQEDTEYGTDWTRQTDTEITVKCDGREAVYDYVGSLMQALDRGEEDPVAMAMRFMRATDAERPLLLGIAAVYLKKDHSDPVPVFGKIRNVFSGRDACMEFLHIDGRQDYIQFDQVIAILETDQSTVYDES